MRDNLMKFSGAKAYTLMTQIEALKGSAKDKSAFIEQSKRLVSIHNETYMNVETQFASAKGSAARDWKQYVKDIDIYPNLKCRTMEDDHVRISHAALDGLIKPLNQWTIIPPFEPGCRCRLEQTLEPSSVHTPTVSFDEKYANNPGISGEIYPEEHNYFQNISSKDRVKVFENTQQMKQFTPYNREIKTKNGNTVYVNDFADISDLDPNIEAAKIIANNLEKSVYIRPHILSEGYKNPEFGIGTTDKLGDLKTYEAYRNDKAIPLANFIKNEVYNCNKQGCSYAVFDLTHASSDDLANILPVKLRGALFDKQQMNKNIVNVILINGKKVGIISRSQLNGKNFRTHFKDLF